MSRLGALEQLVIDPDSKLSAGAQLREAILSAIEREELEPGERMPPVRTLAAALGLAVNTVAKSYSALEEQGVLVGRGRAGTFVTSDSRSGDVRLSAAARAFANEASALGVSHDDAVAAVFEALGVHTGPPRA